MVKNNDVPINVGSHHSLKDVGWVWEGQPLCPGPGVPPSIFGAGEGAVYFGLHRVCYVYGPNTDLAMQKLSNFEEVVCDTTKWEFRYMEDTESWKGYCSEDLLSTAIAEASKVSKLSLKYPNITGVTHDDMFGLYRKEGCSSKQYAEIYDALHSVNSALKFWAGAVMTNKLDSPILKTFLPFVDIINLWVWNSTDLPQLDETIVQWRKAFPNKPIILGCYLRDFSTHSPVPMDLLRFQWERIPHYLDKGLINGYSILGTALIDGHQEQAEWVRDFIAKH